MQHNIPILHKHNAPLNRALATIYGQMVRIEDAEWQTAEVLALQPEFTIDVYMRRSGYRASEHEQRFAVGLCKAGPPE